jgi:hypothetical protein
VAKKNLLRIIDDLKAHAIARAFENSFSPFDILWFLLAIATAFRVGSRLAPAEE